MKNTLRAKLIALSTVLGLGMSLAFAGTAFGAALEWTADQPITFTDGTINFVIQNGSSATTLVVNATTVVVTVPLSDTFTVISSNRSLATTGESVDSVTTATCNGVNAQTVVIAAPAGGAEVITITPGSSACSSGSGGGGGGGGGGGTPPPPTPPVLPPTASSGHPNGTLIIDNGTVYLIKDGTRYGFRDAAEYLSHGYSFGQAVAANAQDMALPQSTFVQKALEGTLVLDLADNRTVYMVGTGATKRGFVSASVFTALGYNFANLPKINLSDYPSGDPIGDAALAHPDGALVLDGQTVWWVRGNTRQGFESMAVFNTYGFNLSKVVTANAADKALAEGALVKFRDGTLVLDGGVYYIISDGKKMMFSSASDLTTRGYKTSNAINVSLSAYASGGTVQ
ncbi:MAG: hypothetical protein A3B10_03920 [Candidatus Doudnabacteria bacterium RIFCSPLOWO2_01_FULL_44_21]|uniref:Uncharacterized protein n=1 Tax=Candidatus Doudnabacteria bacterium RIFCSPLOWO2_01_FULL_44_21 TaxID=1817841 RepID=A0A1F5PYH8_9BACT|nr:MAG: hypothetical protein A3B95_01925 [Candidatus Doudnabacteria bacterium RIFCSPHIGHO2_02_FULL_43_13b]OGE94904.1 MAG: hypothetical protein A3B10_03920 [Candidatus Doudnabacteria bacterium RIFCSPLOWO2_01_FULL_44_21]